MEPEGSSPHSQLPPTVPVMSQPNPVHTPTSHYLKVHPNIILPSTSGSPQRSLSLRFPHKNPVHSSPHHRTCYILRRTLQNVTIACLVECLYPGYVRNLRHCFHVTWCTPYLSSIHDFSVTENCARHVLQRMSRARDSAVA
jgi:hypothetical protein